MRPLIHAAAVVAFALAPVLAYAQLVVTAEPALLVSAESGEAEYVETTTGGGLLLIGDAPKSQVVPAAAVEILSDKPVVSVQAFVGGNLFRPAPIEKLSETRYLLRGDAGKYAIFATSEGGGFAVATVEIGPQPDPKPDDDDDADVDPEPDDEDGEIFVGPLSVMVIEETAERRNLTPDQLAIFNSGPVREYLRTHTETLADGTPAYRFFDDDFTPEQLAGEPAAIRALYDRAKADRGSATGPWVVVSSGQSSASVPLPESPAAFIELLKIYGGE